jgi:hypothetical protein
LVLKKLCPLLAILWPKSKTSPNTHNLQFRVVNLDLTLGGSRSSTLVLAHDYTLSSFFSINYILYFIFLYFIICLNITQFHFLFWGILYHAFPLKLKSIAHIQYMILWIQHTWYVYKWCKFM